MFNHLDSKAKLGSEAIWFSSYTADKKNAKLIDFIEVFSMGHNSFINRPMECFLIGS